MAKFSGKIGFVMTYEKPDDPGIHVTDTVERQYYGDVNRSSRRWTPSSEQINDNLNISNQLSIVADAFLYDNFSCMKYVVYMGARWKITDVELTRPRITMTIGGLYNEQPDDN